MIDEYNSEKFHFRLSEWPYENRNRFTVVIGANGSGKSQLLADIATSFIEKRMKTELIRKQLSDSTPTPTSPSNNNASKRPNLLAVTNLVTDTFPYAKSLNLDYKYLGHKRAINMFTTGSLNHLMISAILDLHNAPEILEKYYEVLDRELKIKSINVDLIRTQNKNAESLIKERLYHQLEGTRGNLRLSRLTGFESLDSNQKINTFASKIRDWMELDSSNLINENNNDNSSFENIYRLSRLCKTFHVKPSAAYNLIKQLRIANFDLWIDKDFEYLPFDKLSTGEQLLLSTIARIAANVTRKSLILIDEPEVGLHPNWQQKFIRLLSRVIPARLECHFIIATHSPFVASEADDVLTPDLVWGHFVEYPDDLGARSIDDILYRVFGARISGSTSIQRDIQILLEHISGTQEHNKIQIRSAFDRLDKIADSDSRELNSVLNSIRFDV